MNTFLEVFTLLPLGFLHGSAGPLLVVLLLVGAVFLVWLFSKLSFSAEDLAKAIFGPMSATLYLLLAGFLALILIFIAWPGGTISNALFGPKNSQKALEMVFLERQQILDQLGAVVNRTLKAKPAIITGQDRAYYEEHKLVVNQLLGTNANVFQTGGEQTVTSLNAALGTIQQLNGETAASLAKAHGWSSGGSESASLVASLKGAELTSYNEKVAALKKESPIYLFDSRDLAVTVVVLGFGALGAAIQGLSSVAVYVGVNKFKVSWMLFYISRPFVGGGVALGFYFVMQGGLSAGVVPAAEGSIIGPSAVSLLVGLFSGEAMEKLRDVAGSLFKSNKFSDSKDDGSMTITAVKFELIASAAAGAKYNAILFGKNFINDMVILVGGNQFGFELVSPEQIKIKDIGADLIEKTRPLNFLLIDVKKDGAILASYQETKEFSKQS